MSTSKTSSVRKRISLDTAVDFCTSANDATFEDIIGDGVLSDEEDDIDDLYDEEDLDAINDAVEEHSDTEQEVSADDLPRPAKRKYTKKVLT